MGAGLADGSVKARPTGDSFAPRPWGLGQRVFFLHDGRTSDLIQAIQQTAAPDRKGTSSCESSMGCRRIKSRIC